MSNASKARITDGRRLARLSKETKWLIDKYGYDTTASWTLCSKARLWFFYHRNWKKVCPNHDDALTISVVYRLRKDEHKATRVEIKKLQDAIQKTREAMKLIQEVECSLSKRGVGGVEDEG